MTPLRFLLVCVAGWMNHRQQLVIEYLQEEIRVLQEQLGKRAAVQRGSTPSTGCQGQAHWAKGSRALGHCCDSRYTSGLAPSSDCQEIRFEQEAQTGSPVDQSGHSRTGLANGTGKSVMGLHAHPRCPGQSATQGWTRHYREHSAR